MKKLITISFILMLFMSQAGYYFIYAVQQYFVREAVKEQLLAGLPDSCLEIIEQTDHMHWEEEGKEFFLNGNSYDVVRSKNVHGKILLFCFNDKKENQISRELEKLVRAKNTHEKNGKHAERVQLNDFTMNSIQWPVSYARLLQKKYFDQEPAIVSSPIKITTPPPRA